MSYASNRTPAVARGAVAGTGARQRDVRARSVAPSSAAASGKTSVRLSSSAAQPMVGLGTWQAPKGQVREAVKAALEGGYVHLDCAAAYANETEVGAALREAFIHPLAAAVHSPANSGPSWCGVEPLPPVDDVRLVAF